MQMHGSGQKMQAHGAFKSGPQLRHSTRICSRATARAASVVFSDAQLLSMPLLELMEAAASVRDSAYSAITFSPSKSCGPACAPSPVAAHVCATRAHTRTGAVLHGRAFSAVTTISDVCVRTVPSPYRAVSRSLYSQKCSFPLPDSAAIHVDTAPLPRPRCPAGART